VYAAQVAIPNLLDLFKKYDIKTTCFTPGHTIETFPNECKWIVDEGHEIALTYIDNYELILRRIENLIGTKSKQSKAKISKIQESINNKLMELKKKLKR